jgi:hypothetical protein
MTSDYNLAELATGRGGIRYGKHVKFNSHIVCEIDLPKVNGVSITPTDYLEEVRGMKRLHDVRGHFRRLRDGRRVWVKSHKRGNKELGTITKDYLLTNKLKEKLNADNTKEHNYGIDS